MVKNTTDNQQKEYETQSIDAKIVSMIETIICNDKTGKEGFSVEGAPVIKLTRQQLYAEIWELTVTGVAKKYNVPYTLLMRQVKKADIPIPPPGYWSKISVGKPVVKPELTGSFDEVVSIFDTALSKHEKKTKEKSKPVTPAKNPPKNGNSKKQPEHIVFPEEPEIKEQYGQTYNVYKRETLYQEVWMAPVTEVAKHYKVSDVTINKVCKSLEIPTPPVGYWAKKRAGKPVKTIPLPKNNTVTQKIGIQTGLTYESKSNEKKEPLEFLNREEQAVILAIASQLLLPDENARMHTKIVAHRKSITEWKGKLRENENKGYGRRNLESPPYLADSVSEESIPRVCRIIDALAKAMEPLGCSLTDDLGFVINGETVRLDFSESKDKVPHIPTKKENLQLLEYEDAQKHHSWASKPQIRKYDHVYNGRLSLMVCYQKSFRDCKSYVIEERLGDVMIEMYEAAENHRKDHIAREEAERKKQEEEQRKEKWQKLYNAEVDRTLALVNLAEDFYTASQIRQYISVIEAANSLDEKTKKWIEWAKNKAEWYDPTIAKEDDFFGKRNHEEDSDSKQLQHIYHWW